MYFSGPSQYYLDLYELKRRKISHLCPVKQSPELMPKRRDLAAVFVTACTDVESPLLDPVYGSASVQLTPGMLNDPLVLTINRHTTIISMIYDRP